MDMAYNNKFVVCVLQNNAICKELATGQVNIEWGEYTIRLRNKNNRRAVARMTIDGENVSEDGFVVPANGYIDIERPVNVAKKFKFVSLDSGEAIDFGKNGPNHDKVKGLIEVKFHLEKPRPTYVQPTYVYGSPWHWNNSPTCGMGASDEGTARPLGTLSRGLVGSSDTRRRSFAPQSLNFVDSDDTSSVLSAAPGAATMDGATVEGDESNQRFRQIHVDIEDNYTTVKLFLQGFDAVENPMVVKEPSPKHIHKLKPTRLTDKVKKANDEIEELELKLAELKKLKLEKEIAELSK